MKKAKVLYWSMPLLALILVFSVIAFIWTDSYAGNFWFGYVVVLLAWTILFVAVICTAKEHQKHDNAIFINAPLVLFAGLHFIFQALSGILTMAFRGYNIKISCTVSLLLLVSFCFVVVGLSCYKSKTSTGNSVQANRRDFILQFRNQLKELALRCTDPISSKHIQEVNEIAKYINPDSVCELSEDEMKLLELLNSLKTAISERNTILIGPVCEEMKILLKKRAF